MVRDRRRLLLGACALIAPGLALGQRQKRARIGVLVVANPEPFLGQLKQGLRTAGYAEGQNLEVLLRSAQGKPSALPALAAELVQLKPDVIVAAQTPAAQSAKDATKSIPIVIVAGDPVGTGLVPSLARPGGNITGMSATTAVVGGKMLELIRELLPGAKRVGVLANATDPFTRPFVEQIEAPAKAVAMSVHTLRIRGSEEYESAFVEFSRQQVQAVIVQPSLPREPAAKLALKHGLPALSPTRSFPEAGGLMSYAASLVEVNRGAAEYVDKILRGAKPSDLPMQQPTKFEFVVNLRTAKALNLNMPRNLLLRADHIIE